MPRNTSAIRRSIAIGATALLAFAGVTLGAGAAHASTSASSVITSVFAKINAVHENQPAGEAFARNDFVDEYAQQLNAAEVKAKGAALTPAETPDPTKTLQPNGEDLDTLPYVGKGSLTSASAANIAAAFDAATPAEFHTQFMDDDYAGIAVTASQGRIYAEIVVIDYDNAHLPQSRIFASKPTITGTPDVGKPLTVHYKVTTPGTTTTYNWSSNGTLVSFGTSPTYVPESPTFGTVITVQAETTKDGYQYLLTTSAPTKKLGAGTIKGFTPVITGSRNVGETLQATAGGEWGPGFVTLNYVWLRSGKVIPGANTSSYQLQDADQGKTVNVRLTGTQDHYATVVKSSASKSKVGAPFIPASFVPTISDSDSTVTVGDVLTAADGGTWTSGTRTSWQWKINGKSVSGATKSTFTIPNSAYTSSGSTITVVETGTLAGFAATSRTSVPTATVHGHDFTVTGSTDIVGVISVGQTVKAQVPSVSPKPTSTKYAWYVNGVRKSTSSSYKIPSNAGSKDLALEVTFTKSGYNTLNPIVIKTVTGAP
jgi:hypothetical protein